LKTLSYAGTGHGIAAKEKIEVLYFNYELPACCTVRAGNRKWR
jgi:hypothetical protein